MPGGRCGARLRLRGVAAEAVATLLTTVDRHFKEGTEVVRIVHRDVDIMPNELPHPPRRIPNTVPEGDQRLDQGIALLMQTNQLLLGIDRKLDKLDTIDAKLDKLDTIDAKLDDLPTRLVDAIAERWPAPLWAAEPDATEAEP